MASSNTIGEGLGGGGIIIIFQNLTYEYFLIYGGVSERSSHLNIWAMEENISSHCPHYSPLTPSCNGHGNLIGK